MQQKIGPGGFIQRCFERVDQSMRQRANEPDRIGQDHWQARRHETSSARGIQRGEQLVRAKRTGARQGIEQRRLAGIRVSDQGYAKRLAPAPRAPLRSPLGVQGAQALAQLLDPLADHPTIQFDLLFPWPGAQSDASALALQVGPAAHQTGRAQRCPESARCGPSPARPARARGCAAAPETRRHPRSRHRSPTQPAGRAPRRPCPVR